MIRPSRSLFGRGTFLESSTCFQYRLKLKLNLGELKLDIPITIFIVGYYSIKWFFRNDDGNGWVSILSNNDSIWAIGAILVWFFVYLLCYVMWTISVNIPLAMFFISAYLIIYTFFGVVFYEGINAGMIITGITNSIDIIEPDLTQEGCAPEDVRIGTLLWWKGLIPRFND